MQKRFFKKDANVKHHEIRDSPGTVAGVRGKKRKKKKKKGEFFVGKKIQDKNPVFSKTSLSSKKCHNFINKSSVTDL